MSFIDPLQLSLEGFQRSSSEFNFHAGECYLQTKVGVAAENALQLSRFIRDFMPTQHREFYQKMPFLIVSSLDSQERPWASILVANPPFLEEDRSSSSPNPPQYQAPPLSPLARSPTDRSLSIEARLNPGDPLLGNIKAGAGLGILGIEPHTRRRNRVNGKLREDPTPSLKGTTQFLFDVDQSFGNCPKYIQAREWNWKDRREQESFGKVERGGSLLPSRLQSLISSSDSLFVASASLNSLPSSFSPDNQDKRQGLDVSHRGGKPGFVSVGSNGNEGEERTVLEYPEYLGNFMFNTLGNVITNPKAGLLFIDYEKGDLLYLTGKAYLAMGVRSKPGAQHTVRFLLDEWIFSNGVLPLEWKFNSESIYNPEIQFGEKGNESRIDSNKLGMSAVRITCQDVQQETHDTFTYTFSTGIALGSIQKPGQYGTFVFDLGDQGTFDRTWTLSSPGGAGSYDLSITVKTKEGGLISNWLKNNMVIEKGIMLKGIEGTFTLEDTLKASTRRIVMFAGGIGITPFISMLRGLKKQQRTLGALLASLPSLGRSASSSSLEPRRFESIDLVYSVRSPADLTFSGELVELTSKELAGILNIHFYLTSSDIPARWNGGRGRLTRTEMDKFFKKENLHETEVMVCGPPAFMETVEKLVEDVGLEKGRLHSENFNY